MTRLQVKATLYALLACVLLIRGGERAYQALRTPDTSDITRLAAWMATPHKFYAKCYQIGPMAGGMRTGDGLPVHCTSYGNTLMPRPSGEWASTYEVGLGTASHRWHPVGLLVDKPKK